MPDSFGVELKRLVRSLVDAEHQGDSDPARELLHTLIRAEAEARGVSVPSALIGSEFLPDALQAVAFDAEASGVDLERFACEVSEARRALSQG